MSKRIEICVEEVQGISIVSADGSVNQEESAEIHQKFKKLIESGVSKIVFDFSKTTYICSMFLGVLVEIHADILIKGGLRLANLNQFQHKLLKATDLDKIMKVCDTVDEAVASFEE